MFEKLGRFLKSFGQQLGSPPQWLLPVPKRSQCSDEKLIQQSAETWAYVCGIYAASAVAQVPLRLYSKTKPGQAAPRVAHRAVAQGAVERVPTVRKAAALAQVNEILDHPILELLRYPNENQCWFEFLQETQLFIDATGDAYWLVQVDALNVPRSLNILPSSHVRIVADKSGAIKWYEFNPGGMVGTVKLSPDSVIHFRNPNPRDQLYGMGCLEAASNASQLITAMTHMELALNENSAIPGLVIKYNGHTTAKDRRRLESEWNAALRGLRNAGRAKVADQDFEIMPVGLSPREMAYMNGRKWSREEIAAAYRVPISLVTVESVNRSNAQAALEQFARFGVSTRITMLQETINRWLLPKYGEPRIFLAFDSPVPEDRDFSLKKLQFAAEQQLMDQNELRAALESIG